MTNLVSEFKEELLSHDKKDRPEELTLQTFSIWSRFGKDAMEIDDPKYCIMQNFLVIVFMFSANPSGF